MKIRKINELSLNGAERNALAVLVAELEAINAKKASAHAVFHKSRYGHQ